jgi:predicted ferric reductase
MEARHIQDFSHGGNVTHHWGYADRLVPCTNDAGSCEYLDEVYGAHDIGMRYVGIFWITVIAVLFAWGVLYRMSSSRLSQTFSSLMNRYLLPEFKAGRWLFGRTTRLQVLVLAILTAYLSVFTFAGIGYHKWITPVKNSPGVYNTRSSLGPWSDRIGTIAYALTPLSILLASRESLLSVITGLPYHHFNFLHRWLGHIIFMQSALHTIGWCVIEIKLYQPQPTVAIEWIKQPYMIWGVVAMIVLLLLWGLSTRWAQRRFGYEFFRKAHYVLAIIYIGAAIGHWSGLQCFLIPSILLWGLDRGIRLGRAALIHYQIMPDGKGLFKSIDATVTHFDEEIVRLDFVSQVRWSTGQHFYVTFSDKSFWQSHPFTPLSVSGPRQAYLFRGKKGETKRIAESTLATLPVILTGPYGQSVTEKLTDDCNVLCIAGGTGVTFVLPVLLELANSSTTGSLELVWVIRHDHDRKWIARELDLLRASDRVKITIVATRDPTNLSSTSSSSASATSSDDKDVPLQTPMTELSENEKVREVHHRPDLPSVVREFVSSTDKGATTVYVSGPASMITDVREEVARYNDPAKVWKGQQEARIELIHDERLE